MKIYKYKKIFDIIYTGIKFLGILYFAFIVGCTPTPETYDDQDHAIRLSDYRGQWIFMNYWATWCSPCLAEMNALNKFYSSNRDKVVVLGVSFDHLSNAEIQDVRKKYAIKYLMASNFPLEKIGIKEIPVLPTTFVLNPQGKITKIIKGPLTETQLSEFLTSFMVQSS